MDQTGEPDGRCVSVLAGEVQHRPAVGVRPVDVGAALDQLIGEREEAPEAGHVQRGHVELVGSGNSHKQPGLPDGLDQCLF